MTKARALTPIGDEKLWPYGSRAALSRSVGDRCTARVFRTKCGGFPANRIARVRGLMDPATAEAWLSPP